MHAQACPEHATSTHRATRPYRRAIATDPATACHVRTRSAADGLTGLSLSCALTLPMRTPGLACKCPVEGAATGHPERATTSRSWLVRRCPASSRSVRKAAAPSDPVTGQQGLVGEHGSPARPMIMPAPAGPISYGGPCRAGLLRMPPARTTSRYGAQGVAALEDASSIKLTARLTSRATAVERSGSRQSRGDERAHVWYWSFCMTILSSNRSRLPLPLSSRFSGCTSSRTPR